MAVPLPYIWFLIASQHSAQHFYYTYRIQAIALFALGYFVLALVDWERLDGALRGLVGRVLPTAHR